MNTSFHSPTTSKLERTKCAGSSGVEYQTIWRTSRSVYGSDLPFASCHCFQRLWRLML
jgi:hypothetical protein